MKVKHWPSKKEWRAIRNQFRNENNKRECFKMDNNQFNKLLHKYKQLRPEFPHKKCIDNVRILIDHAHKRKQIVKMTGYYQILGSHRQLGFIDEALDNALDYCVKKDIL